jgi:dienelactone hydrolase
MRKGTFCVALSFALLGARNDPGIIVQPEESLLDAPIAIHADLRPGTRVTVTLSTHRYGMPFAASASAIVPSDGHLSVGMDLFWQLMPQGPPTRDIEFRRDIDLAPRSYSVEVSNGTHAPLLANLVRRAVNSDVVRTVVDNGPFVATLFSSKNTRCRPGVIVLGGSEGGISEQEAAVIASHGFTALALAYFGLPNLPRSLVNVPLETIERGLSFMKTNAAVCHNRPIGVVGHSKGAELALVAAARFHDVGAVVAFSPSSVVFSGLGDAPPGIADSSWSYDGRPLPYANGVVPKAIEDRIAQLEHARQHVSYAPEYLAQLQNNTESQAIIPVETIAGPVLLIAGGADELWPSLVMSRRIMQRLRDHRHPYADTLLGYPAAGHPINIPYQFAKAELKHAFLLLGGSAESNERASEDSWPRVMQFLSRALAQR